MRNKLLKKLSDEIKEMTKETGGIHKFVDIDENRPRIASWLESVNDIACIFNERNGFELEVNNQKYHNCYFKVDKYVSNNKAMFISVYGIKDGCIDTEEYLIDTVSVFNSKIDYDVNRITVKEEFVPILRELDIIHSDRREKFKQEQCRDVMDYCDKYFCICFIDNKRLKQFCKDWNYQYE